MFINIRTLPKSKSYKSCKCHKKNINTSSIQSLSDDTHTVNHNTENVLAVMYIGGGQECSLNYDVVVNFNAFPLLPQKLIT